MATEERRPRYLAPRQVVARNEILSGVGPAEFGIILVGLALGFGVQWVIGAIGRLVGVPLGYVLVFRVPIGIALGGSGLLMTRPLPGGRILDYTVAMVRFWRRGDAPYLYGPPAE